MNRYIAAGLLGTLAVLLGSGLNNLGNLLPNFGSGNGARALGTSMPGTRPIEQAGKVVQQQNQTAVVTPTTPIFDQGRTMVRGTNTLPQNIPSAEIRPQTTDVIPRTGVEPHSEAMVGDLAPIQSELVQPGTPYTPDEDLDSIPALW